MMNRKLSPLSLRVGAQTDIGRVRQENQDSMSRFLSPFGEVFLVVDGMGGHQGGALAARMVVDGLERHLAALPAETPVEEALFKAAAATHAEILGAAGGAGAHGRTMGATAVLALIRDGRVWIAHAGDSRAYLLRCGNLHRLTQDHTRIQQMIEHKILTEEQAREHPDVSVIQRAFGQGDALELEVAPPRETEPGDRWLLCSDGLSSCVRDEEIAAALRAEGEVQVIARHLVELALAAGGDDNVTVQILAVEGAAKLRRAAVALAAPLGTMTGGSPARSTTPWGWLLVAALFGLAFILGAFLGRPALEAIRQQVPWLHRQAPAPAPPGPSRNPPGQRPKPSHKPPPAVLNPPPEGPPGMVSDNPVEGTTDNLVEGTADVPLATTLAPGLEVEISPRGRAPVLFLRVIESSDSRPGESPLRHKIASLHRGAVAQGKPQTGTIPGTVYYRSGAIGAKDEAQRIAKALAYRIQAWPAELDGEYSDTKVLVVGKPAASAAIPSPTRKKGYVR